MIRRPILLTAAALTLGIAACDGGGDGDPTPTPTPTSTATPTPTASPTYASFPVSAASEFFAFSAATSYTGDPASGAVTLGAAGTDLRSDRVRLAISNNVDTGSFVMREVSEESRFQKTAPSGSTDTYALVTAPAPAVPEYVFRITFADTATVTGKFAQGEFLNNTIPSQVTNDPALALTRTSYSAWWRGDSTTGAKRITYMTWGYPTVASDLPTANNTAVTYSVRIAGRRVLANGTLQQLGGTGTVTVNFVTGLVNVTLNPTILVAGGGSNPFGTFTGQGAIPAGTNQFSGSLAAGGLSGTFVGGFFGSQAAEIGINFALQGATAGVDERSAAAVVGKKN